MIIGNRHVRVKPELGIAFAAFRDMDMDRFPRLTLTGIEVEPIAPIYKNDRHSPLDQRDVRRVLRLHADDVVPGIDVMHLARHAARQIGEQVQARTADILDRDIAL